MKVWELLKKKGKIQKILSNNERKKLKKTNLEKMNKKQGSY